MCKSVKSFEMINELVKCDILIPVCHLKKILNRKSVNLDSLRENEMRKKNTTQMLTFCHQIQSVSNLKFRGSNCK